MANDKLHYVICLFFPLACLAVLGLAWLTNELRGQQTEHLPQWLLLFLVMWAGGIISAAQIRRSWD